MESSKKIQIELSDELFDKLEELNIDVENEIKESLYKKIRCSYSEEELKKGYREMGKINLGFAKMCLEADEDALCVTEQYLTECE